MSAAAAVSPWAARRRRAEELRERYPFAAELLTLYLALVPVQEDAGRRARESPPAPRGAAVVGGGERCCPRSSRRPARPGPPALRDGRPRRPAGEWALAGWLAGEELDPVDRYLARATLGPVLEALGEQAGAACARDGTGTPACPRCGGPPQLSCLAASGEALVNGPRSLLCARCATSWTCSRSVCPACGETQDARLEGVRRAMARAGVGRRRGHGDDGPGVPAPAHRRVLDLQPLPDRGRHGTRRAARSPRSTSWPPCRSTSTPPTRA